MDAHIKAKTMLKRIYLAALLVAAAGPTVAMEDIPPALGIPPIGVTEIYKHCAKAVRLYGLHESEAECVRRAALAYPGIAAEMITDYNKSDCSDPRISEEFTTEAREKCFSGTLKETGEDERRVARKAVCEALAIKGALGGGPAFTRCLMSEDDAN